MTITADVYDIAIFLIGLGFFIIAVALVPAILQLKRTFKAVEDLTQETRKTVEIVNFVGISLGKHKGEAPVAGHFHRPPIFRFRFQLMKT